MLCSLLETDFGVVCAVDGSGLLSAVAASKILSFCSSVGVGLLSASAAMETRSSCSDSMGVDDVGVDDAAS